MSNYYDVLGVKPSDSEEVIKRAWQAGIKAWHPDRHKANPKDRRRAKRMYRAIQDAWRCLRDTKKREAYDKTLASGAGLPDPECKLCNGTGQTMRWLGVIVSFVTCSCVQVKRENSDESNESTQTSGESSEEG